MLLSNAMCGKLLQMKNNFGLWLQLQRENQGLTQSSLARLAGMNRAIINKIENNVSFPTSETIRAIANGLKIPPEEAFRAAGFLPAATQKDARYENLQYIFTELPEQEKVMFLEYGRFLLSKVNNGK